MSQPDLDPASLQRMAHVVAYMENYRALLEAHGFSRENAETMTVRYHSILCAEVELTLILERAGGGA